MDNSHVALVSLQLNSAGFEEFRCDRNLCVLSPPAPTRRVEWRS